MQKPAPRRGRVNVFLSGVTDVFVLKNTRLQTFQSHGNNLPSQNDSRTALAKALPSITILQKKAFEL